MNNIALSFVCIFVFWFLDNLCSLFLLTLQTFPKFSCNLRIGSSSFSILVTKFSECSFYEKRAVHSHFGLACARACSKYFKTLGATLELVHLHFLFCWPSSQITPSMRTKNMLQTICYIHTYISQLYI